jgi:FkbM family methyltransferase
MNSVVDTISRRLRFASERTRHFQPVSARRFEPLLFWTMPQRFADAADLSCRFNIGGVSVRARRCDMVAVQEIGLDGEYAFVGEVLKGVSRPLVVDAGANVGVFSALVLSLCGDAAVHSIEASQDTFRLLQRNQRANAALEWHPHHFALWNSTGCVHVDETATSTARRANESLKGEYVKARTLDDFVREILRPAQRLHLCKLDIEGAEERVLESSHMALRLIDHLVVEVHPGLCDERNVRTLLATAFADVKDISGRCSAKPLLHAFNSRHGAPARTG